MPRWTCPRLHSKVTSAELRLNPSILEQEWAKYGPQATASLPGDFIQLMGRCLVLLYPATISGPVSGWPCCAHMGPSPTHKCSNHRPRERLQECEAPARRGMGSTWLYCVGLACSSQVRHLSHVPVGRAP